MVMGPSATTNRNRYILSLKYLRTRKGFSANEVEQSSVDLKGFCECSRSLKSLWASVSNVELNGKWFSTDTQAPDH